MYCPYLDKKSNCCMKDGSMPSSYTLGSQCCGNYQSCSKMGGGGNEMDKFVNNMFRNY